MHSLSNSPTPTPSSSAEAGAEWVVSRIALYIFYPDTWYMVGAQQLCFE